MKVYAVEYVVPYECSDIERIFRTEEAANAYAEGLKATDRFSAEFYHVNEYEVED